MRLAITAFDYLMPTDEQKQCMARVRAGFAKLAELVETELPSGKDRAHVIRTLRDAGMWANVAITRHYDGTPRT